MYSTIPVLCHHYTPGMQPGHHMITAEKYIYSHSWVLADVAITVWLLDPDKSAILVEEKGLTGFGINVYHEWKRNGKRTINNSLHTGLINIIWGCDNEVQSFLSNKHWLWSHWLIRYIESQQLKTSQDKCICVSKILHGTECKCDWLFFCSFPLASVVYNDSVKERRH